MGRVEELLSKDNRSSVLSRRKMAGIPGAGKTAVGRILQKVGVRAPRHVETTHDAETRWANRWRLAGGNLHLYAGGARTKRTIWSGDTWVDRDAFIRVDAKNDGMYFPIGAKTDDVLGDLCAPGTMVHILVPSAQHGVLLKPHFG